LTWTYQLAIYGHVIYANIAELKNRLSHYLKLVQRGEPVLVKDRDRVVARIEPVLAPSEVGSAEEQLARLVEKGILRGAKGGVGDVDFSSRPRMKRGLSEAVLEEREEGH
jgi:antitoxin (DNA-binding transcriptional repressor) of toxin-antitoxin stability system